MVYMVLQNTRPFGSGVRVNLIGIYDTKEMAQAVQHKVLSKLVNADGAVKDGICVFIQEVEPNSTYSFEYYTGITELSIPGQIKETITLASDSPDANNYLPF